MQSRAENDGNSISKKEKETYAQNESRKIQNMVVTALMIALTSSLHTPSGIMASNSSA